MSNRAMVVVLAIGAIVISALVVVALVTPRLVELQRCPGRFSAVAIFVNPGEVAAVVQSGGSAFVLLRGNSEAIPVCEEASVVAEKLGRVRRLDD